MYKLRKSAEAEEDLTDIWVYSLREWGIEQADKYIDELEAGLAQLSASPKLGTSRDELRPGYRSLRINQHMAYYTVKESTVRIVRVLHVRMEPGQHL